MSSILSEMRIMRSQADRQATEKTLLIQQPKAGRLLAVNSRTGIAIARDPSGNISLGQPISNALASFKTRTSTLNNGSVDFRSATSSV